jgi:hypothetical protein
MRRVTYLILLAAALLPAQDESSEFNVNARYKVSSVDVVPANRYRLSSNIRAEIKRLVGENFNQETVDRLARRLRNELQVHTVHQKVTKGSDPETVKIVLEIERWKDDFELSAPKLVYHSKAGWTGAVDATKSFGPVQIGAGLISDGDELVERYAGVRAHFEHRAVVTGRVRLRFEFDSYHQQWSPITLVALDRRGDLPGVYRTRQNFEPTVTIQLARPLTLSAGASFERFQTQFPAARTEAANAAIATLRFRERWERADTRHGLDAGYTLRAATRELNSDFAYNRHQWDATYFFAVRRQRVVADFAAGELNGRAPLFERFVAGTSRYLRGWNRWDLAPLGGERLAHGTLEYQYRILRVFYDTGSVWDRGQDAAVHHSLGLGLQFDDWWHESSGRPFRKGFTLAVAFPIKDGRADPVFLMGMNF